MGNHSIGRAMVATVEAAAKRRLPDESALDILDEAAELVEIHGADAEFDDAPWEDGAFRSLLIEAFYPDFTPGEDDDDDGFYDLVYVPFSQRYQLC
jgi:hypothetical protein